MTGSNRDLLWITILGFS